MVSMFAVVLFDYPQYPRWSPRCLSPLAYILSFWPDTMVTMLKISNTIQLSGVLCGPPGHIYTMRKSMLLYEKSERTGLNLILLVRFVCFPITLVTPAIRGPVFNRSSESKWRNTAVTTFLHGIQIMHYS